MFPSLLLSFREGLEGSLIIGVLLGMIKKMEKQEYKTAIWAGTISAVVLSVLAGVLLNQIGTSLEGQAEAIFEGVTMLIACLLLTGVIFWIHRQSTSVSQKLQDDMQQAALIGNKNTIFAVAFFSVFREGIELALILVAASFTDSGFQILFGAALGLIGSILLAWLLINSLIRLNLRKFFLFTDILLVLFAAGLLAHGVHELNEAGIIPAIVEHVWDVNPIVDEKTYFGQILTTLFGYNGNPSLTELIAYLGYYLIIFAGFNLHSKGNKSSLVLTS